MFGGVLLAKIRQMWLKQPTLPSNPRGEQHVLEPPVCKCWQKFMCLHSVEIDHTTIRIKLGF